MHYAPIYYKGTSRPDPPPTERREFISPKVTAETLPEYIHQALERRHRHAPLCECGQPAVYIGRCVLLGPLGGGLSGGFFLCEECATQIDAGVGLVKL